MEARVKHRLEVAPTLRLGLARSGSHQEINFINEAGATSPSPDWEKIGWDRQRKIA